HGGDEPGRMGDDPLDRARTAVPLLRELRDLRPPRRDEAVLGRDEEAVQEDQRRDCDQLEKKRHAGAGVWRTDAVAIGATEDAASGRAARPDGSAGGLPDPRTPGAPVLGGKSSSTF